MEVLKDFAWGYVLDKERLKNGSFFNKAYSDNLLEADRTSFLLLFVDTLANMIAFIFLLFYMLVGDDWVDEEIHIQALPTQ